jgi:hypothetical protein
MLNVLVPRKDLALPRVRDVDDFHVSMSGDRLKLWSFGAVDTFNNLKIHFMLTFFENVFKITNGQRD